MNLLLLKATTGDDEVMIAGSNWQKLYDLKKIKFVLWEEVQQVF